MYSSHCYIFGIASLVHRISPEANATFGPKNSGFRSHRKTRGFREVGPMERSKKKVQLWKKAVFHFCFCFVMGFFTGFAPMGKASVFASLSKNSDFSSRPLQPVEVPRPSDSNRSLLAAESPLAVPENSNDMGRLTFLETEEKPEEEEDMSLIPQKLLIVVTPTSTRDRFQDVFIGRLAHTLKLVHPPLLWIVVEGQFKSDKMTEILRKSGIMYRYLVPKENFTDPETETDHQRNVALRHIEQHRLSGIVHFSDISNVYDLNFFEELRDIEVLGAWPKASLSPKRKKLIIEGPICDSSRILGWHRKRTFVEADSESQMDLSNFAFNSSILWDPERWGRPSSSQATSQDPLKFVKEAAAEDESKLKGIPGTDCSRVLHWHLQFPPADSFGGSSRLRETWR
ncbi:hypothetical protein CDL15_Pgr025585 [Punica granatum]|nr:hypothetical protein CDL15_Pgr025585 [Punica granatum]